MAGWNGRVYNAAAAAKAAGSGLRVPKDEIPHFFEEPDLARGEQGIESSEPGLVQGWL
jgi:hypothetical protein